MKNLVLLLFFTFSISTNTTSDAYVGKYMNKMQTKDGNVFGCILELYKDGKFTLQCYRKIAKANQEEIRYARGIWTAQDNSIVFSSLQNDPSPKKMIDISGTKALFKADKKSFKFYQTNIPWLKGLELPKIK